MAGALVDELKNRDYDAAAEIAREKARTREL